MKSYQPFSWPKTQAVNRSARQQGDIISKRGSTVLPAAPRNVRVNSSTGYITIVWDAPQDPQNVQGWRVYLDNENNLIDSIGDVAHRSTQVSLSDHAQHGVYVSSVNPMGKESRKIRAQGAAL